MPTRPDVYIARVLRKCDALKKAGFWDREVRISPRGWLNNFPDNEQPLAARLLDKFQFFSEDMVNRMLTTAARHVGADLTAKRTFIAGVEGENPNPTDSGYMFCRKARQLLKVAEERCLTIDNCAQNLEPGDTLIFVDDFVGTGQQMSATWSRLSGSLKTAGTDPLRIDVRYLGLVATETGVSRIRSTMNIPCHFAHILGPEYHIKEILRGESNAINEVFDEATIIHFLESHAQNLITKSYIDKVWGFNNLGLALAFSHSVPDGSLPIYWADSSTQGWTPLVSRT
ncbi:phosphoribosyltransferase-like protein [Enhygromyxa salina]|uniref:PRTase-CE domain-containing protein n=1 Tax=Enhygromyxa salina TaxID=215803 RepID=A0A2S9YLM0_9BACT|nr:hypothetical protein [Enhygromyxa salina]PRQ06005.1 hypothetical protein ENSA7_42670 [Enhygromyxa salina]